MFGKRFINFHFHFHFDKISSNTANKFQMCFFFSKAHQHKKWIGENSPLSKSDICIVLKGKLITIQFVLKTVNLLYVHTAFWFETLFCA